MSCGISTLINLSACNHKSPPPTQTHIYPTTQHYGSCFQYKFLSMHQLYSLTQAFLCQTYPIKFHAHCSFPVATTAQTVTISLLAFSGSMPGFMCPFSLPLSHFDKNWIFSSYIVYLKNNIKLVVEKSNN